MKKKNNQVILQNLECDTLLEGTITTFQNDFLIAYSSTNVGLNLFLKDEDNKVLWKGSHTATSRAGSIPFSPIGLATGLFSASTNTEDEIAFQMIDTVVRRLLKTLPDKSNVKNIDQLKFAKIPNWLSKASRNYHTSYLLKKAIAKRDQNTISLAVKILSKKNRGWSNRPVRGLRR